MGCDLIVDLFAGGGGASLGIEWALGRSTDIAVNHDAAAVAMHTANHPRTKHLCGDVFHYSPREVTGGRSVDLLWASPDCTHFSRAKGGKPRNKKIRGLAWVVARWAREVRPRIICLENVTEFQGWGPLDDDGQPIPDKSGFTFRRWVADIRRAGYIVEWRELVACDYGTPQKRKRLFLVARCDGQPIVWPAPTHGVPSGLFPLKPYRTAAECLDWTIPVRSIFGRKKPLAEKTLARIARGTFRYVLGAARPFIVSAGGPEYAGEPKPIDAPFGTLLARNHRYIVAPTLVQTGYGERETQTPRTLDLHAPMGTIVAGGAKQALVAAFLARHYGGHENDGADLRGPLSTITTQDHHALVTLPLGKDRRGEVRAFLTKYYGTSTGQPLHAPLGTVTAGAEHFGLVTVDGLPYEIADIGMRMLTPRELFRGQGFPDSYVIDPIVGGKPLSKTVQIEKCGNSVPPQLVEAIIRANVARESAVAA